MYRVNAGIFFHRMLKGSVLIVDNIGGCSAIRPILVNKYMLQAYAAGFSSSTVPVKQFHSDGISDETLTGGSKFSLYCLGVKVHKVSGITSCGAVYDMEFTITQTW